MNKQESRKIKKDALLLIFILAEGSDYFYYILCRQRL